jgi:predicted nuclease with TOPRIM domain
VKDAIERLRQASQNEHTTIALSDALHRRDAELGALRARVAELEAENARLREIPCWVESEDGHPGWGKTADAVEMLGNAYARIEKLEKIETVLHDLLDNISTPTLDDPRLDYVEVQVDRDALAQARLALVEKQKAKTS